MSHSGASSPSSRPLASRPKTSRPSASRKAAIEKTGRKTGRKSDRSHHAGLPLPLKRLVRSIFSTSSGRENGAKSRRLSKAISNYPHKVLWAGGSVATLALLAVLPARVGSQAIASSSCQQVIKSGAEVSRGELSRLLSIPQGASREAVRQVIDAPYCLLPVAGSGQLDGTQASKQAIEQTSGEAAVEKAATREAYPLAFDPEAWIVVNYSAGEYTSYDFVFKQ